MNDRIERMVIKFRDVLETERLPPESFAPIRRPC
jgi:hypothetical protein